MIDRASNADGEPTVTRALRTIERLEARLESVERQRREPIAIVGMACRFPGGVDDPDAFWRLLREGRTTVSEVPADRFDLDALYDPDPDVPGKMYMRTGSFLEQVDGFDPAFFRISPREAVQMDPQQRLFLEVAWEALENTGIVPGDLAGSTTGVFTGVLTNDYAHLPGTLAERVDAYYYPGTNSSFIAGRLSYFLDLRGPSITLDTACSSSLVAAHLACQSLRSGESNLALAGGVNLLLSPESSIFLCKARAMSPTGQCRAFDEAADGMVRGEGCGVLVLKRLSDAIGDGDQVLALLRGSAVNHDGASGGLTVPNPDAQQKLYRAALTDAGVVPADVGYVETHGTGTRLGDPIELQGLAAVFGRDRPREQSLLVGSVKTNIGHTDSAAGVAGLIKAVLMLRHREVPASLHFDHPTSQFQWADHPVRVADRLTALPLPGTVPRVGVTSFGLSGVNAHAVLEGYEPTGVPEETVGKAPECEILPLAAADPGALRQLAQRYRALLRNAASTASAQPLCAAAATRRAQLGHRKGFVGATQESLAAAIDDWLASDLSLSAVPAGERRRIAFVFSGQGPQWWAMGRELMAGDQGFREKLEEIEALFREHAGWSLLEQMGADESATRIHETEVAQPAMFSIQVALADRWQRWGVVPEVVIGHSMGEVAAAHVAGVLSLSDAVRVIHHRGRILGKATGRGRMLAVAMPLAECEQLVAGFEGQVSIAVVNSPHSAVLSGDPEAMDEVQAQLEARDVFNRELRVKFASHCPQMEALQPELAEAVAGVEPLPRSLTLISTVTGRLAAPGDYDADYWARNIRAPVLFATAVDVALDQGIDTFVEIDPHPILAGSMSECLECREEMGLVIHSLHHDKGEREALLESLAILYSNGYPLDFRKLYPEPTTAQVLPNYPWQRRRFWLDNGDRVPTQESSTHTSPGALVGDQIASPLASAQFQTELGANRPNYMIGHRVVGKVVASAAAFLCLSNAAARFSCGESIVLSDVSFTAPLALGDVPCKVQVVVTPADHAGHSSVEIHSHTGRDAETLWTRHSLATFETAAPEPTSQRPPNADNFASIQGRSQRQSVDEFYDAAARRGLEYDGRFRAIRELWIGSDEVLARACIEDAANEIEAAAGLHPALLDACLHAVMTILPGDAPYVPAAIERFRVDGEVGSELWSHGRLRYADDSSARVDFDFYDATGQLVGQLEGLFLRRLESWSVDPYEEGDAYRLVWERTPIANYETATETLGRWLLLVDEGGVGARVAEHLGACGVDHVTVRCGKAWACESGNRWVVDWADPDHLARLLTELRERDLLCDRVLYLWGLNAREAGSHDGVSLLDEQERLCGGALHLVQGLVRADWQRPPQVWLVTAGAVHVPAYDGPMNPSQASLWGLARVAALEHVELRCACLDLDPAASGDQAGLIVKEVLFNEAESEVALRRGVRHVARLIPAPDQDLSAQSFPDSRTWRLGDYGILDDLRLAPAPRRAPGPAEVEVAVRAVGLNFRDVLSALGTLDDLLRELGIDSAEKLPFGFECAGVVVATGAGVEGFRTGDEVMVALVPGCLSSFVTAPVSHVALKPSSLRYEQAATLPIAYFTAYHALHHLADMRAGDRVLIHAAAGGVGQAAIQLAQRAGAEIYATASQEKWPMLRAQGLEQVMDSRSLRFADEVLAATGGRGVDIVLNSLGGEFASRSLEVCARNGRFIEIGAIDVAQPEQVAVSRPDVSYAAFNLQLEVAQKPDLMQELMGQLTDDLERGEFEPLRFETFPMDDARSAFRYMAQARHKGKIVITMSDSKGTMPAPCHGDGSYLITGGLGALGLRVAEWLAAQGARHLVLAGRRVPDANAEVVVGRLRQQDIEVRLVRADVTDQDAVAALFEEIDREMPPLRGVVHAAAVLDDGVLTRQSPERFRRVLGPKVSGAWNLHAATIDRPLDFFVCFSSAVALLGAPGQGNYAAANAFLDALAQFRQRQGLAGLSINWGPWAETGLAAELSERDRARWLERGVRLIEPEHGLAALSRALAGEASHIMVLPVDWSRYLGQMASERLTAMLAGMRPAERPEAGRRGGLAARLEDASAEEREPMLAAHVRQEVVKVLGLGTPEAIAPRQRLFDLGLDSLMALELKNRLEASLGRRLRSTLVFDYPTVDGLVQHLIGDVLALVAESTATTGTDETLSSDVDGLGGDELASLLERELSELERDPAT